MYKIAFVCVDFNGWEYTRKLCRSLEGQVGLGVEFSLQCVVMDNSTDEENSRKLCESLDGLDWVIYRHANKNAGYFGGINLGLDCLNLSEWNFLVVCNNDLEFDVNFCKKLISKSYRRDVFSVCPDVVTFDGLYQNPHVLQRIGRLRRFQFDLYFSHYYVARLMSMILGIVRPVKVSPPQPVVGCEIHMGIGAIYVLTSEFLKRFKKLDFPHFLYGEEAYFSDQIHAAGGILWFDPDLRVSHAESATLSKVPKRTAYEFARSGYPSYRKML